MCEKTQRFVLEAGLMIGKPFDCLSMVDFLTLQLLLSIKLYCRAILSKMRIVAFSWSSGGLRL